MGSTLECSSYTPALGNQEWVLVDGTPASCVHVGLHHLFSDLPPVDLVVSGPNFGPNATTVYNLSSGTVGGALEAALCGKKAIAISFASKDEQSPELITTAARTSVRLIERLHRKWDQGVELYNINVPMVANVGTCQVLYTRALPSYWTTGSLYREVKPTEHINGNINSYTRRNNNSTSGEHADKPTDGNFDKDTNQQVNGNANGPRNGSYENHQDSDEQLNSPQIPSIPKRRYFRWDPQLSDIAHSMEENLLGTDAWTVQHGSIRYEYLCFYSLGSK